MVEKTVFRGMYTDGVVYLPESEIEENCYDQIDRFVNHEAFQGSTVRIMPDTHYGAGAPIGLTATLNGRVSPNTVGVDIGCFAGDTKVSLLDGEDYRIEGLANRDGSFPVYSCKTDGEVVVGEATARKTRTDAELVRVTLDNGEEIECTPDHEFMLRDGTYAEAQDLDRGTSLMPLYTTEDPDGYEVVTQNIPEKPPSRAHWLVAESGMMGDIPTSEDSITVIHHKNEVKDDNRPENLEFMTMSEHSRYHRELSDNEHWQSEEFEERRIQALKERDATEAEIEAATENITTYMEGNPEHFAEVAEENGERGAEYLEDFNTSERECSICGEEMDNPASEYWHQIKDHPEETEYEVRENHEVEAVEHLDKTEDVYCLNVPEYHNFALSSGVFVHNCGMIAVNYGNVRLSAESVDEVVRDAVPMGRSTRSGGYHMGRDFPYGQANLVVADFIEEYEARFDESIEFDGYDIEYVKDLAEKVGADINRVISSVGTLGGGNHFIEFCNSVETDDVWCVLHSGSRHLGLKVAQYWQEQATQYMNEAYDRTDPRAEEVREVLAEYPDDYVKFDRDVSDEELLTWVTGGMGEDFINYEAIPKTERENVREGLKEAHHIAQDEWDPSDALDFLEGEAAHGYFIDMIFAQQYALENRREMIRLITDAIGVEPKDAVSSPHNYIDPADLVIRKGACRAWEGERFVVPFNMADGTLLCKGKGNEDWNQSAPHGAGRVMSRRQAKREVTPEEAEEALGDTYASVVPLDEAPAAYKETALIEDAIEPTADVVDRLKPFLSMKSED